MASLKDCEAGEGARGKGEGWEYTAVDPERTVPAPAPPSPWLASLPSHGVETQAGSSPA